MFERLEKKKIAGQSYYYYSQWGWVNGKCRRLWQRYLGKAKDIAAAVEGGGPAPRCAEIFDWGLPQALWQVARRLRVASIIERLCPKRRQGLSTGEYLTIAALNRAIAPCSKRSMWEWFSSTVLVRLFPGASQAALSSQRFWDHMGRVDRASARSVWKEILTGVIEREPIDLSSICYDGTNFYTFIDTFNVRCKIAKRGKNKQGRNNLRQINYALFCCAEGRIPLYYELYDGNRNDAGHFPEALANFARFFGELTKHKQSAPGSTLIFDKGNNSADNLALVDELNLDFVGSVKNDEHKELACIPNDDKRLKPCQTPELEGVRAFRTTKEIYGKERTVVVTFNDNLHQAQCRTVENDIAKVLEKLSTLQQRLRDRTAGRIRGGRAPTLESVRKQCEGALHRPFLKQIITVDIKEGQGEKATPELRYQIDAGAREEIFNTYLGKNILISSHENWSNEKIIRAYRSQYQIEEVYKQMKERHCGPWWPLNHWTDQMIEVHGLYCTIAVLMRGLMMRRIQAAGINLSLGRAMKELAAIREVVNIYPATRRKKNETRQVVLSRLNKVQEKLMRALDLTPKTDV